MEIDLVNVGIVKSAHLEFKEGLNLIVGASSSGKSTLLRAIKSFIDNTFVDSNISYGETKLAVRIKHNGHSFTFVRDTEKQNRKSSYQIDGKVYTNLGRLPLAELANTLNLSPIEIDGEKVNFNFSSQFAGPFLLLGSASLLYSILTYRSSFDITKINDLYFTDVKKIKQDTSVLLKTKESVIKERDSLGKKFQSLSTVPDLYKDVQSFKNRHSEFHTLQDTIDTYKRTYNAITASTFKRNTLQRILAQLEQYNDLLFFVTAIGSYISLQSQYSLLMNNILNKETILNSIQGILPVFMLVKNILSYTNLSIDINTLSSTIGKRESILKQLSIVLNLCMLTKRIREYVILSSKHERNKAILCSFTIPSLNAITYLHSYKERVSDIQLVTNSLNGIKESYSSVIDEINKVGVCPLCNQPVCEH